MNLLTILLLAILVLVSTEPDAASQTALAETAIEGTSAEVAIGTLPAVTVALSAPQPDVKVVASAQPTLDVTGDFVQDRLRTASYHLRKRFILQ
jgi:hypothetical protein